MHTLLHSVPLTLQQATVDPCLHGLLDTYRQAWISLLWGQCSFLLGPGVHKVLFVPCKSLFPQSCVSSVIKSHCPPMWRRQWQPTPVLLPGKSHGQRSLVGYSPWGHEHLDRTEQLHFHFHALEKEMATHSSMFAWRIPGTGAWWATVYGVTQSRTRLM